MSEQTLPPQSNPAPASLEDLGWKPFFQAQLAAEEYDGLVPARVTAVHRSHLHILGVTVDADITLFFDPNGGETANATIGDWLMVDPETGFAQSMLERFSLFKRRAPGRGREVQLIAANVDTVFIVTSCNQDFNLARLERYLTLARQADVMPVIVLTKPDLAEDPDWYVEQAQSLDRTLCVEVLNATLDEAVQRLLPWCGHGQTVVFVGSSGVGKSTLVKTLTGSERIATQGIREDDAKGRHTTSSRELYQLGTGAWLVDTPGMRELSLSDVKGGLEVVFADLSEIASGCRFNDCAHTVEPGCAIMAGIERGELDAARVERWKKLVAEDAFNAQSLQERRAQGKAMTRMIKATTKSKAKKR